MTRDTLQTDCRYVGSVDRLSSRELRHRIVPLFGQAGYRPEEPVMVGIQLAGLGEVHFAQGATVSGTRLTSRSVTYTASLSKQMTAACLALLVKQGVLHTESRLAEWLPGLPDWGESVRLRHLVHHTAGLPDDTDIDAAWAAAGHIDRTTRGVLSGLALFPCLSAEPGTRYAYSNTGYVCLAAVIERAANCPLPDLAREYLFGPLGMSDTSYWPGPAPTPPTAVPLDPEHPAPLSLGDGGVWSSPRDLLRWSQSLNQDGLGISAVLQRPGSLDDGTPLDYAWGLGVRSHAGHRIYRHGGGWTNLRALLIRASALDLSLMILAVADNTERRLQLADDILHTVIV